MEFKGYNCEEVVDWFNASLESIHNGIIAVNNSGEIIFFNKSSEKMLNLKKEEVLGKKVSHVIPESDLPQTLNKEKEETGQRLTINGRDIYSNRAPIIHDGKMIGAIAIFQDLTGIKNVKTELKEAKDDLNLLDTILNDAYEAIVIVDKEGRITKFNKAYEEFLGVKEEDVLDKHVTEVIENTRMHIICKTGEKEMGRVQHIEGNDMICNRIPFKKNGEVVGAIGKVLFKDVKELKHLARRLEVLEDRLKHYKREVKRLQEAKYSFENIITKNSKMKHLKNIAR
ncbi:MAG: PAS domain-containing protein, partial [Bacillota bacterium]